MQCTGVCVQSSKHLNACSIKELGQAFKNYINTNMITLVTMVNAAFIVWAAALLGPNSLC